MSFGCFLGGFRTTLGALWATGESLWGALGLIGVTLGALGVTLGSFGMPLRHLGSLFGHFLSRVEDFLKNKRASRSHAKTGFFRGCLDCAGVRFIDILGKFGSQKALKPAQACVLETFLFF